MNLRERIPAKVKELNFVHFGGNSLRRVHVFLRDQKKTYHPFFEPEMGVSPSSAPFLQKKAKKRPKNGREEKSFFHP